MAYFVVIGTNNDVKGVVDEIRNAHLQHNVVTSGCVLGEGDNLYYQWEVFNGQGDKTNDNNDSIELKSALTNQISQFKTLLPSDVVPNVFIVSSCFSNDSCETLKMVYEELCHIGGAKMLGLHVDIVLLGYDLNVPEDVTVRPDWKLLETLRGLEKTGNFSTDILYINNMDYTGAATNLDAKVLGKFLCYWSKMVCAGDYNPKLSVRSNVYSIGMSEHQYDFRDLNEFFRLSAEERLLDRTLDAEPSEDTRALTAHNYFRKIDLSYPWIDGLCTIQKDWKKYCLTEWDSSKPLSENLYSLCRHEHELASYLNQFLRLYISEEEREIANLTELNAQMEAEIVVTDALIATLQAAVDPASGEQPDMVQIIAAETKKADLRDQIDANLLQIKVHRTNISKTRFIDADEFHANYGTMELITEDDEAAYAAARQMVESLVKYVKSDDAVRIMREAVSRATVEDVLPRPYPAMTVLNMGRVVQRDLPATGAPDLPETNVVAEDLSERPGCLGWLKGLFGSRSAADPEGSVAINTPNLIDEASRSFLYNALNKCVAEIKKADDVRSWWRTLCDMISRYRMRKNECWLLMDGAVPSSNGCKSGHKGYMIESHVKSTSLIDMDMVRHFRDSDAYYSQVIAIFLARWFDKNIEFDQRSTMPELIKHQVLDSLVGKFHTLKWDGTNPFVKEKMTDDEIHEYLMHDIRQSKPFVEYVRIQDFNITSNLNIGFFSNHPDIPREPTEFRNRYNTGAVTVSPVYLDEFTNSLCTIQVMNIPDHIDSLKDFKPRREAVLEPLRVDMREEIVSIIGEASTVRDKAKAIYDWICDNIAYDTTKQIFDAETCWKIKRGVCNAYCELFCHMAAAAGLTADIVLGITKNHNNEISDERHAWVFVYTNAYDGLLIDPTWGAGSVKDGKFIKSDDNSAWFDVSPYWMIFSHFPINRYWTKLEIDVDESKFTSLPYMHPTSEVDGKDFLFESVAKL